MAAVPKNGQKGDDNDTPYWSAPGFVENGYSPILNVQAGTFVVKKKQDSDGVDCFELYEIVSTPNEKQFSQSF